MVRTVVIIYFYTVHSKQPMTVTTNEKNLRCKTRNIHFTCTVLPISYGNFSVSFISIQGWNSYLNFATEPQVSFKIPDLKAGNNLDNTEEKKQR